METHEMVVGEVTEYGAEIWVCPNCSRSFIIRSWQPLVREILNPGDDVPHKGYFVNSQPQQEGPPYWWTLD